MPSQSWSDETVISSLVSETSAADVVVFHCMKSLQRGTTTAQLFASQLQLKIAAGEENVPQV